jgi:N-acetylmuramoyl-L-alanine amidase
MKWIAPLAISVSILGAQSPRPNIRAVTAVRHWSLADTTRVAIEVTGDFTYRTERLHNPERVYFDIVNARPRLDSGRFYSVSVDDKLVSKIRVAETNPGVTRVVLDLNGLAESTASQLSNPYRLIVELRAGTAPAIPSAPPATIVAPPAVITPVMRPEPPPPVRTTSKPKTESADVAMPAPTPTPIVEASAPLPAKTDPILGELSKAARHTSTGNTSLVRALGLKLGRVVIDPGHGGHDQGTEGPHGLLEKELVLDVAQRVGKLIEERLGAEVVYTRSDDIFIPLETRTAIANDRKADLFLSIHANSSPVPRIAGVETYYRNMTTSREALDVAARENASSQKSIAELQDLIQKVVQGEKVEESRDFAARVQSSLFAFSARNFPGTKDRGVKKAPFVVLIGAKVPSVLVEIGFLSNSREEALLRKSDYRQKLAEALFRGVSRYADSLSHNQVAKAGE